MHVYLCMTACRGGMEMLTVQKAGLGLANWLLFHMFKGMFPNSQPIIDQAYEPTSREFAFGPMLQFR